jgi:DNA-binding MarR family transcriptional regulator
MKANPPIDTIVDNLFYALPVIHKRIMRIDPPDIDCGIRLSRLHIGIMVRINEKSSTITEIASSFLMPKSQISNLITSMVNAGLLERSRNAHDRRVTDVRLTPRGKDIFDQCDKHLKDNVREILSSLSAKELEELAESLLILKKIGPKLDN